MFYFKSLYRQHFISCLKRLKRLHQQNEIPLSCPHRSAASGSTFSPELMFNYSAAHWSDDVPLNIDCHATPNQRKISAWNLTSCVKCGHSSPEVPSSLLQSCSLTSCRLRRLHWATPDSGSLAYGWKSDYTRSVFWSPGCLLICRLDRATGESWARATEATRRSSDSSTTFPGYLRTPFPKALHLFRTRWFKRVVGRTPSFGI